VVDASLSASATAESAGAKSQLASLVTVALVLVTLLLLAPLFSQLPNAILAAIVITSVLSLLDLSGLVALYQQRRADALLALSALLGVVFSGVLTGLLLAVLLGLVLVLYQSSRPRLAVLGVVPEHSGSYTDISRNPENLPVPGLLMVRIDAPLYYFNINYLVGELRALIDGAEPRPRGLLIDVGSSADLDLSTIDVLRAFVDELDEREIAVLFSHVRGPVRDRLARVGLLDGVRERIFVTTDQAVRAFITESFARANGQPTIGPEAVRSDPV
jgi:SulP family sulfate permease